MGSMMSAPETSKETGSENGELAGSRIGYGVSSMQGWRVSMEDTHIHRLNLAKGDGSGAAKLQQLALFGVFDGHGGYKVSEYLADNLVDELCANEAFCQVESAEGEENAHKLGEALRQSFLSIDDKMSKLAPVKNGEDFSGSTAIVCLVTPTHLVVANTGDSRLAVCDGPNGKVRFASEDHKPDNVSERQRIEAAGGSVMYHRVNGDLAVSRALGDFQYKKNDKVSAVQQQVSAEPEISVLGRTNEDKFVLLACDGIWDVMSNQAACAYVLEMLQLGLPLGITCETLLNRCLNLNSRDNMSAIVVCLPGAPWDKISTLPKEQIDDLLRKQQYEQTPQPQFGQLSQQQNSFA